MRLSVLPLLAVLSLGGTACDEALTGPAAQKAYSDAADHIRVVPANRIVFLDGQRLAPGERLDQIDSKDIVRVEVLKGEAAARLYGNEARGGVIRIYSARGSADRAVR